MSSELWKASGREYVVGLKIGFRIEIGGRIPEPLETTGPHSSHAILRLNIILTSFVSPVPVAASRRRSNGPESVGVQAAIVIPAGLTRSRLTPHPLCDLERPR